MSTFAEKQFAAFIDRILRLKEEQDSLAADIRDVYLEMKSAGYDKTAAGNLVTELRKREKNGAKFEETNAVLDLYRTAYENAKSSHTHAYARARTISQSQQPSSHPVAAEPEAIPPTVASGSPFTVQVKTARDYRPHCQSPDACASFSLDHCHTCKKAILAEEAA